MNTENSMTFTPEDIGKGLLGDFLSALLKMQREMKDTIDIRISIDGYCEIVNWATTYEEDPRHYELIEGDQFVDEWIYGTSADGHNIAYRATDLEDDNFCHQNGIVYDKVKRQWAIDSSESLRDESLREKLDKRK